MAGGLVLVCWAILLFYAKFAALTAEGPGASTGQNRNRPVGTCPSDMASFEVPALSDAILQQSGHDRVESFSLRTSIFAVPAEVEWGDDLLPLGAWSTAQDGTLTWRLCLHSPGAHSLTLLFSPIYLPPGSSLWAFHPAVAGSTLPSVCQRFPAFCQRLTLTNLRRDGTLLAAPVPGEALVLEYRAPGDQGQTRRPFSAALQSALVGVKPLPLGLVLEEGEGEGEGGWFDDGSKGGVGDTSGQSPPGGKWRGELGAAEGPSRGGVVPRRNGRGLSQGGDRVSSPGLTPELVRRYIEYTLNTTAGTSLPCGVNAACEPEWSKEAQAVVLIVVVDDSGSRICTGTLINSPTQEQYIASANHCLGLGTEEVAGSHWGVVFNYEVPCGEEDNPAAYQYQMLQGVEVVWHNEISDVLLLRLDDDIPWAYRPYYLGWDASGWATAPNGSVCIHQAKGDVKHIAFTTNPLRMGSYLVPEQTHYLVTWTRGVTEEGSSGAMLVDAATRRGLGVMTGTFQTTPICDGGTDLFGSLYEAWEMGLWEFLGAGGVDGPATMGPRRARRSGPGLFVSPDEVRVVEGGDPVDLDVRLSEAPRAGEEITVTLRLVHEGVASAPPVNITTRELLFTAADWNVSQVVEVLPGEDEVAGEVLPFRILLTLRSSTRRALVKRRVIKGVRLDDDSPDGTTPDQPIPILSLPFQHTGRLLRPGASRPSPLPGNTTLQELQGSSRWGAVAYFELDNPQRLSLGVKLCLVGQRRGQEVQLAVVIDSVVKWTTPEGCATPGSGSVYPDGTICRPLPAQSGCVGYEELDIPAVNAMPPTMLAVYSLSKRTGRFSLQIGDLNAGLVGS